MQQHKIIISYVNNKTLAERKHNGEKKVFSQYKKNVIRKDDIILQVNTDTNMVVAIGVSAGELEPRHLLDNDVFAGEDAKYHKSEVKLQSLRYFEKGISLLDVGTLCGIPKEDKTPNNISKRTPFEYSEVFYKGDDAEIIIAKFRILVNSWL